MATIYASLSDNSVRDFTDDAVNGSEVDANPQAIANILDGTTTTIGVNQVGAMFYTKVPYTIEHKDFRVKVLNSGNAAAFAIGEMLYIKGYDSATGYYIAGKAIVTATSSTTFYARLVAEEAIASGSSGNACKVLVVTDNTTGTTIGDKIYLATTAGDYTSTMPAAENRIQVVGSVVTVGASGKIRFDLPGWVIPWSVADQI